MSLHVVNAWFDRDLVFGFLFVVSVGPAADGAPCFRDGGGIPRLVFPRTSPVGFLCVVSVGPVGDGAPCFRDGGSIPRLTTPRTPPVKAPPRFSPSGSSHGSFLTPVRAVWPYSPSLPRAAGLVHLAEPSILHESPFLSSQFLCRHLVGFILDAISTADRRDRASSRDTLATAGSFAPSRCLHSDGAPWFLPAPPPAPPRLVWVPFP